MKKKELDDIYQEVFEDALHYMAEDHTVQAVAATYMAIAMRGILFFNEIFSFRSLHISAEKDSKIRIECIDEH